MIGKFAMVWKLAQLEAGRPPEALLEEALALGLGMVALKIADGAATADGSGPDGRIRWYVQELHKRGVQVWGWQYLYGGRRLVKNESGQVIGSTENSYSTPEREAAVAVARVRQFGLDGYIMDPEAEYKTAPAGRAGRFVSLVRAGLGAAGLGALPVGLCSYRYPLYHKELPWGEFLTQTDTHMPQVYWGQGANNTGLLNDGRYLAAVELEESVRQLRALKDIPFLPVGRAYIGDGHANPRPAELSAFMACAKALNHAGAGFWNWDSLRPGYPGAVGRAAAISAYAFGAAPAAPVGAGVTCPNCKIFIPFVQA